MSAGRSERDRPDRLLAELQQALVPVARPNLLLVAWRWRYELFLAVGVPLGITALARALDTWETTAVVLVVAAVGMSWARARRALTARFWCVVTPHRVRVGCVQARLHNRRGRLPAILWTSAVPEGETVMLWCPAGTTPRDVAAAGDLLATACLATEVVVAAHPRWAQLVTLTVVRRRSQRPTGILAEGPEPWDPDALVLPPGLPSSRH